ncbi:IS110 family transposase [Paenibacillus sp. FSL H7-0331]|uniref:IS110 family transposase n=1 Tax=Paenibacillus sp. FSL H7-0331 TaxID=1920421 RepID=UPI002116A3C7|nr:IS110 family transposase [Paenibacillus sp. FSL H7-0331]
MELKALPEQYDMFNRQLQDMMTQVEQLLEIIPGTEEVLTIPCVAIVTLAGFLAEVGDLQGYEHSKQINRLAGFNLKENSSVKKKVNQRSQNVDDPDCERYYSTR